ncbi:MAG TPA: helix-turn-helix domain-containing protein [Gemmatimonadaceae bacterium]|nr:helix-turn-helix domain-containing protein [Gemmatimonadaceae bacterium]
MSIGTGYSATAPGVVAGWHRRDADEVEFTAVEHQVIVLLTPIENKESRSDGVRYRRYAAGAGFVHVIPAGSSHWARWHGPKETAHFALSPSKLDEVARLHFDRDGAELMMHREPVADRTIAHVARLLRDELCHSASGMSALYLDSLATLLGVHLLRHHSTLDARPTPPHRGGLAAPARRAVLDYMAAHLARDLTVTELAAVAGLAPNSFARAFRQTLGTTPHQHLLALRVSAAERLLAESDLALSAIAYATGFSSQSHMTTTFARLRGRTPGAHRREQVRRDV